MFKVLSIDGGGIRGIYPAAFLAEFENKIPVHKCFDLVTGTSTGGIIALGIGYLPSVQAVVELYSKHAKEIFPRQRFRFRSGYGLTRSKYSNRPLIDRLKKTFGEGVFFENPNCRLRIQAFDLITGRAKIFSQSIGEPNDHDAKFRVWEVAAATSAAPTFFPSFDTNGRGLFVDGGIWANNPALVGLAEAIRFEPKLKNVRILSIGTGSKVLRSNKKRSGVVSWGFDLIDVSFQSQSDGVHAIVSKFDLDSLKRFSPALGVSESELDSISGIATLEGLGRSDAQANRQELIREFFYE